MANKVQKYLMTLVMAVLVIALFVGVITATGLVVGVASADDNPPIQQRSSEINLSDFDSFHWVLKGHNSNLRSGRVYVYSYKDQDNNTTDSFGNPLEYYSMTPLSAAPNADWKEWTLTATRNVNASIVRYRTNPDFDHEIEIFSDYLNNGFTVREYGGEPYATKGTKPGKYIAEVVLEAQEGFTFIDLPTTGTSSLDRGMKITIQNEAKRAVIEKEWYIAIYDNALLDQSSAEGVEVDFEMPSWKFGEGNRINYPLLRHGDALITDAADNQPENYTLLVNGESITTEVDGKVVLKPEWDPRNGNACTHDILTFTLVNTDTHQTIAQDARRSQWRYYINEYMPVANYALTINVETLTLGTHMHWFSDPSSPDYIHQEPEGLTSDYIGFERTFNFSVTPGTIAMNDSALNFADNDEKAPIEVNIADLEYGHDAFFAATSSITYGAEMLKWSDIEGTPTYWGSENMASLYDETPTLTYSLYRMRDLNYYPADDSVWNDFLDEPSLYVVYYAASMKNYTSYPALADRAKNFYRVKLYRIVDVPSLNRDEMIYTGGQLIVGPEGADTRIMNWTGNRQTNAGEYTVTFTFNEPDYYKWRNTNDNDRVLDFNESFTLPWKISPAVVEVPVLAERNYLGKDSQGNDRTLTPEITIPRNQNTTRDVFSVTYPDGYSDGKFSEAGSYDITLTLENANNYVWESELRTPPANRKAAITVKFIINPLENTWDINPSIRHWQWNAYDKDVNILTGSARQGGTLFTVYTDEACTKPAAGLESFAVSNGVVTDVTADAFKKLHAGDYWLIGRVAAGKNYTGLTSDKIAFNVGIARNQWASNVNIIRWSYGSFDAETNIITAKPLFGENVILSVVTRSGETDTVVAGLGDIKIDANGKVLGGAAQTLAALGAGYYHLIATVEREIAGYVDNDVNKPIYNYGELVGDIEFRISIAQNFWETTPNIPRWIIGEQIQMPVAVPHFGAGTLQFIIRNSANEVIYDNISGVNNLATARPGWHTLQARVQETNNYTDLDSITRFRVFGTDVNFWLEVPNIQGWKVGETANLPTANAAFGEVTYTYKTADGVVLNSAPTEAGDYILVATATSDEFEDMIAEVAFTIYPLSEAETRETALIAVVSVFAVIIALGAVAAVVVGVIANKRKKANVQAKPFNNNGGEI